MKLTRREGREARQQDIDRETEDRGSEKRRGGGGEKSCFLRGMRRMFAWADAGVSFVTMKM